MFLGIRHPRSTRLNLADLSDAPAHEITSPALSNQGAGPMEPGCGPSKVAGRSVGDPEEPLPTLRPATSPTTQTWSDREFRLTRAKRFGVDIASGAQLNDDADGIDRNPRQCPTDVFWLRPPSTVTQNH